MPETAVLTNDMQYDIANKNQNRTNAVAKGTPRFKSFLNKMRSLNVPVIHLQLICLPDDPNTEWWGDYQTCRRGSKGAKILEDFYDESDIIVEKNKDSGFFETTLDDTLKELGVKTVIVTGMQTQICVQTTSADAFFRGYNVIVPPDAVLSSKPEDTKRALNWLGSYFATIINCSRIEEIVSKGEKFPLKKVDIQ